MCIRDRPMAPPAAAAARNPPPPAPCPYGHSPQAAPPGPGGCGRSAPAAEEMCIRDRIYDGHIRRQDRMPQQMPAALGGVQQKRRAAQGGFPAPASRRSRHSRLPAQQRQPALFQKSARREDVYKRQISHSSSQYSTSSKGSCSTGAPVMTMPSKFRSFTWSKVW